MFMQGVAFSSALLIGAGAKIVYDFLLFRSFRRLKPPRSVLPPALTRRAKLSKGKRRVTRYLLPGQIPPQIGWEEEM
jgi:hypothetical protein